MSDESQQDSETSSRNKSYGAQDHLAHLLKIGYQKDSLIIKDFVLKNNLEIPTE